MNFEGAVVYLRRPVTVVSGALNVKSFEILAELVSLEIFLSPEERMSDFDLSQLGHRISVDFRIDEEGGSSTLESSPSGPDDSPTENRGINFSESEDRFSGKTFLGGPR